MGVFHVVLKQTSIIRSRYWSYPDTVMLPSELLRFRTMHRSRCSMVRVTRASRVRVRFKVSTVMDKVSLNVSRTCRIS